MGLGRKRTVRSVNTNIDKAIDRSGMEVDMGIKDFMIRKKKSTIMGLDEKEAELFGLKKKSKSVFG